MFDRVADSTLVKVVTPQLSSGPLCGTGSAHGCGLRNGNALEIKTRSVEQTFALPVLSNSNVAVRFYEAHLC